MDDKSAVMKAVDRASELEAQLADCQRWTSAWKRLARRLRKREYEYWNKYCDQFEETKKVKHQRDAAVEALEAVEFVHFSYNDVVGYRCPWCKCDMSHFHDCPRQAALALCDE